jgi:trk system potassium uptake protein TrkH
LGFLVLPGLYVGPRLSVIDALFTATSAVCVTGLVVVDTATFFTGWGHVWIALLIQLGGLGILTIATLIILALGRRPALAVGESVGQQVPRRLGSPRAVLRSVVVVTVIAEAAGAMVLWLSWGGEMGWARAVLPAVFHAISAFCNAGFSTFSTSLVGFREHGPILATISALIILGGLGFVVLTDVWIRVVPRTARRLSLHTTLVLTTTVVLLVGGAVLFYFFEAANVLEGMGVVTRALNAFFMSVTARTAGFNTVDYGAISDTSVVLTIIFMVIGGSPGSTAGGIKTTTVALLTLLFVSYLRGKRNVSARHRTVQPEHVALATGLAVGTVALLAAAVFVLMISELPVNVQDRTLLVRATFEAASAFGTVGLSMGLTPALTTAGKVIITFLMFLGRVGPLTLAASMAIAAQRRQAHYRHAFEDVVVG